MPPKKKPLPSGRGKAKAKAKAKGLTKKKAGPKVSPKKRAVPEAEADEEEEVEAGEEQAEAEAEESPSKRARSAASPAAAEETQPDEGMVGEHPQAQAEDGEDEDDEPLANMVPAQPSQPEAGAGVDLEAEGNDPGGAGPDTGADVWAQLETELQVPLNLPVEQDTPEDSVQKQDAAVHGVADDKDSDDEWGNVWTGSIAQQSTSILDEIANNAARAADFHKEKWEKKEEVREEDEEEEETWGLEQYQSEKEKQMMKEIWLPDDSWSEWTSNSKEALAAENIVRKIRSRAGVPEKPSSDVELEPFPSPDLLEALQLWVARDIHDQRLLLAALLWVEASTVEVEIVRPDLNSYALGLMSKEENRRALKAACEHVPHMVMLQKADASIPGFNLRSEEGPKVLKLLISSLSGMLYHGDFQMDEEDLSSVFDEVFADQPLTARIAALVHLNEKAELMKKLWDDKSDLISEMKKLAALHRTVEVVCRLTLPQAIYLAQQALNKDLHEFRKCKIDSFNRLGTEWRTTPQEEHLMQLHTLSMQRQLQVMLSVERDIELQWYHLTSKVKSQEQSRQMRAYTVFEERLRPYLNEEDLTSGKQKRDLESESGQSMETKDLAGVRQGVAEVLKKLKHRYQWKPNWNSRREISRVNWVARLSALVRLANKTTCLFADEDLRRLLREDEKRKLGREVLDKFRQWFKLERGDGLALKGVRIASEQLREKMRKRYEDYGQTFAGTRFQPHTPAGLGVAAMTPGLGSMTPGLNPGTPGISGGGVTPIFRAQPQEPHFTTAKLYEQSEGNTPQWKGPLTPNLPHMQPMTPGGVPSSMTPRAAGTPAGPPPATPAQLGQAARSTPVGPSNSFTPTLPGAQPFTPAGAGVGAPFTPVPEHLRTPGGGGSTPSGQPPQTPAQQPNSAFAPTTPLAAQRGIKSESV